jgi:transposase-like protein
VTSDAHRGLESAIEKILQGASWQRCRVHFMRNAISLLPKAARRMVGATVRAVFAQPDAPRAPASSGARSRTVSVRAFPRLAELMDEAEEDVLSYAAFPQEHRQKIRSNNHLERLNKEVKRRTEVVGIFPNETAVVRLVGPCSASITTSGRWASATSAPAPWRNWSRRKRRRSSRS